MIKLIMASAMPSAYRIPKRIIRNLKRAAERADIHEICYIVYGRGSSILRLVRVPNRAADTIMHHEIRWDDYRRIRKRESKSGLKALGFLHTHVLGAASPSRADLAGYEPGTLLFIYADHRDELRAFRISSSGKGYVEKRVFLLETDPLV